MQRSATRPYEGWYGGGGVHCASSSWAGDIAKPVRTRQCFFAGLESGPFGRPVRHACSDVSEAEQVTKHEGRPTRRIHLAAGDGKHATPQGESRDGDALVQPQQSDPAARDLSISDPASQPPTRARELHEELGIEADRYTPWITREFVYPHAHVRLHFFRVSGWHGEIRDIHHDALAWKWADCVDVAPMPNGAPHFGQ